MDTRKNIKISPELHKFIKVHSAKAELSIENFLELCLIEGAIQSESDELKERIFSLKTRPSIGSDSIEERLLANAFLAFTNGMPSEEEKEAWGKLVMEKEDTEELN